MNKENKVIDSFAKVLSRGLVTCGAGCLAATMIAVTARLILWLF